MRVQGFRFEVLGFRIWVQGFGFRANTGVGIIKNSIASHGHFYFYTRIATPPPPQKKKKKNNNNK